MAQSNVPGEPAAAPDPLIEEADSQIERHPDMSYPVAVAPSDFGDTSKFNTLRPAIRTVACWRLDDQRFDFDSSFINPSTRADLARLALLEDDYADCPISIFGHADPVGSDDYNKKLSGHRAKAIFALLTRNTAMWEELFKADDWGLRSTQIILLFVEDRAIAQLPEEEQATAARFPGPPDGKDSADWREAVKRFQTQKGIGVDGDAGPATRAKLYEEYMRLLCTNDAGKELRLEPERFLGKGSDDKGKAAFQGCSEFNPVLLLSEDESKELEKAKRTEERNRLNAPNRRVVLYFFPPGLIVDPAKWPCPRADEGRAGCLKRFWSDHERRRKPAASERRAYGPFVETVDADTNQPGITRGTRDTFACRFYDRLARHSPCEAGFEEWIVQILAPGEGSLRERARIAAVRFEAVVGGRVTRGHTDANGVLRVRARADTETIAVKLTVPVDPRLETGARDTSVTLTLQGGALRELGDPVALARIQRLRNLGLGPANLAAWTADPTVLEGAAQVFAKANQGEERDLDELLKEIYGA